MAFLCFALVISLPILSEMILTGAVHLKNVLPMSDEPYSWSSVLQNLVYLIFTAWGGYLCFDVIIYDMYFQIAINVNLLEEKIGNLRNTRPISEKEELKKFRNYLMEFN